jgi:hypothetical protein
MRALIGVCARESPPSARQGNGKVKQKNSFVSAGWPSRKPLAVSGPLELEVAFERKSLARNPRRKPYVSEAKPVIAAAGRKSPRGPTTSDLREADVAPSWRARGGAIAAPG